MIGNRKEEGRVCTVLFHCKSLTPTKNRWWKLKCTAYGCGFHSKVTQCQSTTSGQLLVILSPSNSSLSQPTFLVASPVPDQQNSNDVWCCDVIMTSSEVPASSLFLDSSCQQYFLLYSPNEKKERVTARVCCCVRSCEQERAWEWRERGRVCLACHKSQWRLLLETKLVNQEKRKGPK